MRVYLRYKSECRFNPKDIEETAKLSAFRKEYEALRFCPRAFGVLQHLPSQPAYQSNRANREPAQSRTALVFYQAASAGTLCRDESDRQ